MKISSFLYLVMDVPSDSLGRPVRDLRLSVTDRCNFRCPYCMPKESFGPGHPFLANELLMNPAEMIRIVRIFAALGVEKVRLTGGEPLLRKDLPDLVASIKRDVGIPDVSLTTNGWFLAKQAGALRAAGLDRINVSVDSVDEAIAGRMNGLGFSVARVLEGIDAAAAAGFPIKVNCVVQRGLNDAGIVPLCAYFRGRGIPIRFIEFMDVGNTNRWSHAQVVPAREIVERISAQWPLAPVGSAYRGEVASRYRYADGRGEIGVISSVTKPFCRDCNRARISADGKLFTCLFASSGQDVLGRLRAGAGDGDLADFVSGVWRARSDRYSEERAGVVPGAAPREKIEMSYIGG